MKELEIIKPAVIRAGNLAMDFYGLDTTTLKEDGTPVTVADKVANKTLIDMIKANFPDDAILSEETPDNLERLTKQRVWLIDPIDGTQDYIDQTGDFAVMIALVEKGRPTLGIMYAPAQQKLYTAVQGQGAYVEGDHWKRKLTVSRTTEINRATVTINRHSKRRILDYLQAGNCIPGGSGGLRVARITEQQADIHVSHTGQTKQWDTAAADIILHEAGGRMTDIHGQPLQYNESEHNHPPLIISTNGQLHEKVLSKMRNYRA